MDSAFYRVTSRAIIRDDQDRVLVLRRKKDGRYELPGGGWEYEETFRDCLTREITEELGVELVSAGDDIWFTYRGFNQRRGSWALRLAVPAKIASHNFILDEAIESARFVDAQEFVGLDWLDIEQEVCQHIDKLWPRS